MYWNTLFNVWGAALSKININMRCIEILPEQDYTKILIQININMRCIEIGEFDDVTNMQDRLTLTWDVLKF